MEVSEEQIAELKAAFALLDKGGKGSVTVEELTEIMCSLGQPPIETQLKKIISEVDVEGTGRIDCADFVAIITKQAVTVSEEDQLREVFKVFDKNGEGFITAPKLKEVLAVLGVTFSDEQLQELIALADRKGEGKIDFEIFHDLFKSKPKDAPKS